MLNTAEGVGAGQDIRHRSGIKIVPYVELNGRRTLTDEMVAAIWEQMLADGTANVVFGGSVKDKEQFVTMFKNHNIFPILIGVGEVPAGVAWLSDVGKNYAHGHFCLFGNSWGRALPVGKAILDYWFSMHKDGLPVLDVIIGKVPATNKLAVAFIKKLGFEILGTIPLIGGDMGLVISYITRQKNG